jgi:carbon monoxide dehydrogenase subunit G
MPSLSCSIRIRATQQQVFDAITDLERAPERISGIESVEVLTEGPMAQGTRWRETRIMMKKKCTEEMEIVEFDPPTGYRTSAFSCGCHYDSGLTVTPDGEEMILEMSFKGTPQTFMAKLMTPLSKLMMGPMRKLMDKDLADIKKYVERGSAR